MYGCMCVCTVWWAYSIDYTWFYPNCVLYTALFQLRNSNYLSILSSLVVSAWHVASCRGVSCCVVFSLVVCCLSVFLSVYLFLYPSISLPVYQSISLSIYLSVCLPACLSACLPACLSVCLSLHPSIQTAIHPSIFSMCGYFSLLCLSLRKPLVIPMSANKS